MVTAPSGEQHVIRLGDQEAVITEVGAGLRSYTAGGRPVIDGYGVDERSTGGRGQTLIPWPNRIRSGRYLWQGTTQQLDLSEPEASGAIHGLTRWSPWRRIDQDTHRGRFEYVLHACPGWPFVLGCELSYTLDASGLSVRTAATNLGVDACPYGTGAHPYLRPAAPTIDAALLTVPARVHLPVDGAGIPTAHEAVDGTPFDLRRSSPIGDRRIDVTFTDLEREPDGRARVRLADPRGAGVALWVDEAYPYLQIYTGDDVPEADRRRNGLAVEPMTCPPDAFNSREGLIVLEPGDTATASWGIEPTLGTGPASGATPTPS